MSEPTESKMFIDSRGRGMVSHRRRVNNGRADLRIVSEPQHDRHSAALEAEIITHAQTRGGTFVRLSDLTRAVQSANARAHGVSTHAAPELPTALWASVAPEPRPGAFPLPKCLPQQELAAELDGVPLRLKVFAAQPEHSRYAARAGAYLWNDLQALPPEARRAVTRELSSADSKLPLTRQLGQQAIDKVRADEGWEHNPGIGAYCLPGRAVAKQERVHPPRRR